VMQGTHTRLIMSVPILKKNPAVYSAKCTGEFEEEDVRISLPKQSPFAKPLGNCTPAHLHVALSKMEGELCPMATQARAFSPYHKPWSELSAAGRNQWPGIMLEVLCWPSRLNSSLHGNAHHQAWRNGFACEHWRLLFGAYPRLSNPQNHLYLAALL